MHRFKVAVLGCLSHLPGAVGRAAETRRLRRVRARLAPASVARFERCVGGLDAGSVCVDLGANQGVYTERLAATGGRVHAFEPDPWAFGKLRDRVGHMANVTLIDAAAGVREGTVRMRRNVGFEADPAGESVGTSILECTPDLPVGATFEARCVDFLRFLRELDRDVDILKMDIEGAEVPLLEALLDAPERDRIKAAFVETHEVNMPELRPRIAALRTRLDGRVFDLDWP